MDQGGCGIIYNFSPLLYKSLKLLDGTTVVSGGIREVPLSSPWNFCGKEEVKIVMLLAAPRP